MIVFKNPTVTYGYSTNTSLIPNSARLVSDTPTVEQAETPVLSLEKATAGIDDGKPSSINFDAEKRRLLTAATYDVQREFISLDGLKTIETTTNANASTVFPGLVYRPLAGTWLFRSYRLDEKLSTKKYKLYKEVA